MQRYKMGSAAGILTVTVMAFLMPDAFTEEAWIPEPARSADGFVETIGVATHWGFHNTIYATKWERVQALLGGLGVRTIRDGLDPHVEDLWKMYGVRAILVTEPGQSWEKMMDTWKAKRHLIAAIEGPNECNGSWDKLHLSYKGKTWPEGPHLFQDDLFKNVKDDPILKDIPVICLSTAYKGAGPEIAPLRSFDFCNAHSYAGGGVPSGSLDFHDPYLLLGRGAVCPPLAATESGYHTCLGNTKVVAGNQNGVTHAAHRKYIPRQIAEYFNAGLHWSVIYEFACGRPNKTEDEDPEAAFGLLQPDATPKPAYHALKSLIDALSESRWDSAAAKWIRPALIAPRALAFALRGAPESLHHTLLQRADGSFQLLLWNEISSYDLHKKKDIHNPDAAVKVALRDKAESVSVSRLGPDAPPAEKFDAVTEFEVKVPDEVIVVAIKLANAPAAAKLDPPAAINVKTAPTSVELAWPAAPAAAAYWVALNGRNLGAANKGADNQATFTLNRLIPATTYNFEIVATALDGGVSSATKAQATTVDAFPDLVVRSLKTIPESPKEGETVKFVAVVENCGNAQTDEGVMIGTSFRVDGKVLSWNDRLIGPLEPGKPVEVIPNSGPAGLVPWVLTRGCHHVTACVDDVNRIIESNKTNNKLTITLSTGVGPDLIVKDLKAKQAQQDKPLIADVVIANQGSEGIAKETPVSASIYRVDTNPPQLLGRAVAHEAIAAGGSITVTVNCDAQIQLEQGKHKLRAIVDEEHRIAELDENNNQAEFEIEVAAPQ